MHEVEGYVDEPREPSWAAEPITAGEGVLGPEQEARAIALLHARTALSGGGINSGRPQCVDLLAVAQWIINGIEHHERP